MEIIGSADSGATGEGELGEGELGAVGIEAAWEIRGGGAMGLERGLERGERIVTKGEVGVEEGGET